MYYYNNNNYYYYKYCYYKKNIIIYLFFYYYYYFFLVPSQVKIPRVKNIKLKSDLEWLTFGVILIDEGASESNLIETLY